MLNRASQIHDHDTLLFSNYIVSSEEREKVKMSTREEGASTIIARIASLRLLVPLFTTAARVPSIAPAPIITTRSDSLAVRSSVSPFPTRPGRP